MIGSSRVGKLGVLVRLLEIVTCAIASLVAIYPIAKSGEFGRASLEAFPPEAMPTSKHNVFCRQLGHNCEVVFQGRVMKVVGYEGIDRSQLIRFRTDKDGHDDFMFYVTYRSNDGKNLSALFILGHQRAAREFGLALARWYEQDPQPYPNYRYPNSQGPQDIQGR